MGCLYAQIKPQMQTEHGPALYVYRRVTSGEQTGGCMTVRARTYTKAERQRNVQAGVQWQQLASHGRAPAQKAKQRGQGARREPAANPFGSLPVPAGGKPWQEGGLCGRKTWQAECPHTAERPSGDAGGGGAGAERGAHPAPSTGADRSPAGRQTGRGRRRASSARDGTARPGRPERLPAAARDTRGEDGAHPAAAPLTLRWEPPPRPWRRRGGRELTAAEGRRWPAAQRGTARRRRHRPSRAPPSLYSLPPARPPLRQPRGAAHSPERRRTRPGSGRSAAGAEHGFPHTGAGPGPCPAARPPLEHGSCGQDPDPGMAAQVAPLQNGNKLTWPSCSFKSETLVLLTAV